ncbi:MAG TPA: hypothetical protein VJ824_14740 [Bacillota bacterium]|nr:hypothetical protein [Bacillota bacterium]
MMKEEGITFLEICVVISLFTVLLLVSLPPLVSSYQKQQSQLFIAQLASDLMYITELSKTEQTIYYLYLPPNQNQYLISSPFNNFRKTGTIPTGYKISNNFPSNRVTFIESGQVLQGGTIRIKDSQGKTCDFIIQLSSGRFRLSCGP